MSAESPRKSNQFEIELGIGYKRKEHKNILVDDWRTCVLNVQSKFQIQIEPIENLLILV